MTKTYMNGAENRLVKLQERIEEIEDCLDGVNLIPIKEALDKIVKVREEVTILASEVRDARMLAMPPNWIFLMKYDTGFYEKFLGEMDIHFFRLALEKADEKTVKKLSWVIEEVSGKSNDS